MSKRYIREIAGGGLEITIFTETPHNMGDRIEIDESELIGKNPDKCRIDQAGKIYEDATIITEQERNEQAKNKAKEKLKNFGFMDHEIKAIIK